MTDKPLRSHARWKPATNRLVLGGAAMVIVLLCASSFVDMRKARDTALLDNDRELSSLSSAIAEHTARSIQAVQLILRRASIAVNAESAQKSPREAADILRRQMDDAPQLRELSIADASGQLVASSVQGSVAHVNVAERAYFRQLSRLTGDAIVIGEPIASFFDHRRTLPIAMGLHDPQGRFVGAVIASMEDDYFAAFYAQIDLTPGTRIRLLTSAGAMTAGYERPPAIEDAAVRSVVREVPGFPLKIEVARANALVFAGWRGAVRNVIARTVLISLFIAMLAGYLAKQLQRVQRINAQLRSSEDRWKAVFENAPVGIVVLDRELRCLATNPAFAQMVGYSRESLGSMRLADITFPEDVDISRRHMEALADARVERVHYTKRYLHRDGRIVWVDIRAALSSSRLPHEDAATPDHRPRIVSTVEDITQRLDDEQTLRRLESQLRQSQKLEALGTFAGGIAHDFNNILGVILGYGERALARMDSHAAEHRDIEQVMKAGERARLLIARILMFSRSSMTNLAPVDVRKVVLESIELVDGTLPPRVSLRTDVTDLPCPVLGDATHFHQVVMNLCSNAVQAMPEGGVLEISLREASFDEDRLLSHANLASGRYVQLRIGDTGVGISDDVLERMFNPFFTTRKTGEGTGLGLSLVDGIVRECGGAIDVSTVTGKGTSFTLYFPVTLTPLIDAPREEEDLPHGDGQIVMLVDDEEALVALGEEALAELGYEPVGFASSTTAWESFLSAPDRFDIVVTDHSMPDLAGMELIQRIRVIRPDIPIVLASGHSGLELDVFAQSMGIRLLRKPVLRRDLAFALEAQCRQRG